MGIRSYIKENKVLLADGAMGTYYYEKCGQKSTLSEKANISSLNDIIEIHKEYIKNGARLIRTNSFAANSNNFDKNNGELKLVIENSIIAARTAAENNDIIIAASIGPVMFSEENEDIYYKEYKYIVDIFLDKGIKVFIFETFSDYDKIEKILEYLYKVEPNVEIIVNFTITTNGETRKGISLKEISLKMGSYKDKIIGFGFNCGMGPMPMYNTIKNTIKDYNIIAALPNAGYPEIVNERTVYNQSPEYYAESIIKFIEAGVKIVGGCCGTTPLHIYKIAEFINKNDFSVLEEKSMKFEKKQEIKKIENRFKNKIENDEFVFAVELDPPFDYNISKIMNAANELKNSSVDIITISDSPIGKVRCNSIIIASKIKRETNIDTMPHLCCRDRNIIGINSDIIGAQSEDINNFLFVTGDPIPSADRNEIKSVFNFNSQGLMELAKKINNSSEEKSIFFGGALNLNLPNKEKEIERMYKKSEKGAAFFLTQPVYEDETIDFIIQHTNIMKEYKVLIGIMPIVSYNNGQFLNNEVPGIKIPEKYLNRFKKNMDRDTAENVGIEIAVELGLKVKECGAGIYLITPFNRAGMIKKIINRLK